MGKMSTSLLNWVSEYQSVVHHLGPLSGHSETSTSQPSLFPIILKRKVYGGTRPRQNDHFRTFWGKSNFSLGWGYGGHHGVNLKRKVRAQKVDVEKRTDTLCSTMDIGVELILRICPETLLLLTRVWVLTLISLILSTQPRRDETNRLGVRIVRPFATVNEIILFRLLTTSWNVMNV